MLDPTSQDYFGSEASQLAGTRRGFGTTSTDGASPVVPALPSITTSGAPSGGSLAPPPVPSATSTFGTQSLPTAKIAPTNTDGGIRLAPPPPPETTPAPPPSAKVPVGTTPSTTSSLPGPIPGQAPSQYVLALINAGLSPQAAADKANADLGLGYGTSAVYYNDSRGQTIGLPEAYLAIGPDGKWGITQRSPETASSSTPAAIPTTGNPSTPLDLSSIDSFANDPSTQFLQDFVQQYLSTLLGAPYSDQQTAAIKAGPMNAIEAGRQQALQQAREQLGSMGVAPTSGVVAETERQINAQYDALRAQSDQNFATQAITRTDTNKQQALSLAGLLADLPVQRLQVAEQAAGMSANPANLFNELLNFGNSAASQNLTQQQLQMQYQQGLGSILGSLASSFKPTTTSPSGGATMPFLSF